MQGIEQGRAEMFGWFRKKKVPKGPVEFDAEIEVAASTEKFFALLDFADPRNAKRELGHSIIEQGGNAYDLVMAFMPDAVFPITDIKRVPHSHYSYRCDIPEGFGALLFTRESYDIEPIDSDRCKVSMQVVGEFASELSMEEFAHEVAMLSLGCENALTKLQAHAEGGLEAVRAFEELQAE